MRPLPEWGGTVRLLVGNELLERSRLLREFPYDLGVECEQAEVEAGRLYLSLELRSACGSLVAGQLDVTAPGDGAAGARAAHRHGSLPVAKREVELLIG